MDSSVASHADWYLSVERYSSRSLSFANDSLPAVSALASTLSENFGGTFCAGLWVNDLHRGLLWAHYGVTNPEKYLRETPVSLNDGSNTEDYVAPSWSWACQPNYVGWTWGIDTLKYMPELEYLGHDVPIASFRNPFGRVKIGGRLQLDAKITKLPSLEFHRDVVWLGHIFPHVLSSGGQYVAHLLFDWRHSSSVIPENELTGEDDVARDGPVDQVSMILVASRFMNDGEKHTRKDKLSQDELQQEIMLGLLVLPVDGEAGGYRRVGLFYSEATGLGGRKFWDNVERSRVALL
ncbi:hypothetical protein ONZ45_g1418 [Pleurotus djamor]|nr:hypothetical protein ONZ45_g1418 [Pleurotus djamor]